MSSFKYSENPVGVAPSFPYELTGTSQDAKDFATHIIDDFAMNVDRGINSVRDQLVKNAVKRFRKHCMPVTPPQTEFVDNIDLTRRNGYDLSTVLGVSNLLNDFISDLVYNGDVHIPSKIRTNAVARSLKRAGLTGLRTILRKQPPTTECQRLQDEMVALRESHKRELRNARTRERNAKKTINEVSGKLTIIYNNLEAVEDELHYANEQLEEVVSLAFVGGEMLPAATTTEDEVFNVEETAEPKIE
jgi:hypothetical protein